MEKKFHWQDYERQPVPLSDRKRWWSLSLVWIAIGIDLSSILLGGQLGAGMPLDQALLSVVIGSLVLAVFSSLCSYVGAMTGLSTAMISRFVFGEYGARLVAGVIGVSLFGWFGVQAGFFGASAGALLEQLSGVTPPESVLSLVGGLLMTTTAVFGYRAVEKLSIWSVPLMVGLLISSVVFAFAGNGGNQLNALPAGEPLTLGMAISFVVGIFLVGTVISPDVARWARTKKDAVLSAFFGFLIGNSLMLFIAIFLSKVTGTGDLVKIFTSLGMGIPAMLILILAQWTTNDNNLYSSSLSWSVVFRKLSKVWITLIAGIVGSFIAFFGIYNHFTDFLSYLTVLVSPIGGIYLAEYFLLDRSRFSFAYIREQKMPVFWWRSMIAWLGASFVSFATTPAPGGFGWFQFTTIPAMDGILVGFLLQWLIGRLFPTQGNREKEKKVTA
ncbi:cytosine permease [Melghirimyces algeriensis]|uniref:Cytosine permease n=1 Tax=Melghirimyces algeriensis TaxID=910412 RepID=A0A521AIK9_9BACL|nr:cytosine permease [Melghirimyces algeriensis]SMO34642.1 cytosine permease [Melghirimyces algeriensis]